MNDNTFHCVGTAPLNEVTAQDQTEEGSIAIQDNAYHPQH